VIAITRFKPVNLEIIIWASHLNCVNGLSKTQRDCN
jgi:hypothetical protein